MSNNPYYKLLTQSMLFAGILALVLGGATYLISSSLGSAQTILLIIGGLLVVGYLVTSPDVLTGAVRSRGLKYGGNTAAMIALVVIIVGAANWFTSSHSQSFDLTRERLHTLTSQTTDILKNLHQDVKVTAFFQTGTEQQAKDLLSEYASKSPYVQYRFVDPDKDPATARQFGIVSYGTTVFQSGNNRKDVPSVGEQDFTSALLAVTATERRKVYFVIGNGQPDPTSAQEQGYHEALLALQNNNYVVGTLDASASAVPDDAAAVILTAGTKPLLDGQKAALTSYLSKGGKMLVAGSAFSETDLNDVVKPFGLQFQSGITIDPASSLQQSPQIPAVARFATSGSDIVKNVAVTLFPVADGIQTPQQPPQGITITPIARSSDQSWLVNRQESSQWSFRQGDTRGPINLLVTAEGTLPQSPGPSAPAAGTPTPIGGLTNPGAVGTPPPASSSPAASAAASSSAQANAQPTQTPTPIPQVTGADVNLKGGARLVAVASSRFMDDQFIDIPQAGNRDLLINSINHLVGNQALVNIPARNAQSSQVVLLGSDANLIFFTTVLFIPLAVLILGGAVWWSRR